MKNSIKRTLILIIMCCVVFATVLYLVFGINTSKNIEFSPSNISKKKSHKIVNKKPKNIIVFIADGMGFSHLSLAMLTHNSKEKPSVFQEFTTKSWHDPRSFFGPITDSGASATAIATGALTNNGVIGLDEKGNRISTVLEEASNLDYITGIVTDSYIWDATPAAFISHTKSRKNASDILTQIASSKLNLIFGELEDVGEEDVPNKKSTLDILEKRFVLLDKFLILPNENLAKNPIAAIFAEDEIQDLDSSPNLPELTRIALKKMDSENKPFILLIESEEMDSGSHKNNIKRVLKGIKSIEETLALILTFSKKNKETLILFTSDHETGGLSIVANSENYPSVQTKWSTKDHTASIVPILAIGPGSEYFSDIHRNWQIGVLLKKLLSSK